MKICQIYNDASHYRASVYRLIDKEFDSDYIFGEASDGIKQMDTSVLRGKVTIVKHINWHSFYWQKGVLKLALKKYDAYLLLGDSHCLSMWLLCILLRLFYPKRRVYMWTHGWYGKENKFEKITKKLFYRLAKDGVFLYGNYARALMIEEGFNPNKLYVIHNSLDYEAQLKIRQTLHNRTIYFEHFGNDNKNIAFIGRLTPVKRFDLLIDAISILKQRGEFVNVTFIGDGVERKKMEEMVKVRDLSEQIWFYGACYDEVTNAELIFNADLCVSPGNIGLTAIHVMMFGCPAITNDDFNHQMPEFEAIQEGGTGAFFKAGDSSSLAESISEWFSNHKTDRENVREQCYRVIDTQWNPSFQLEVLKSKLY